MGWLNKLLKLVSKDAKNLRSEIPLVEFSVQEAQKREAGSVEGLHYTGYVEDVKQLKREKRHSAAIDLLLKLIDATEAEARVAGKGWGVAPWYYEQLAIIYRKEKRFAEEVAVLERYKAQPKAPGIGPSKLDERLKKARKLLESAP